MSVSQFAALLDTSASSLKRWEAGTSVPSVAHRESLLNLLQFGVRADYDSWRCHPGWWLRVCRVRSGLSIRQAAELTQTSHSSWQRFEIGDAPIELLQSIELASTLGPLSKQLGQNLTQSITDAITTRANLPSTDRAQACTIYMSEIFALDRERCDLSDSEYYFRSAQLHNKLGYCVMELGDHDLAGKCSLAATRLTHLSSILDAIPKITQTGRVWIGYPSIRRKEIASNRFEWLESKASRFASGEVPNLAPLRAMFADWSGRTNISIELLERCNKDALTHDVAAIIDLALGWYQSKSGNFSLGLKLAERYIDDANVKLRFLATKVMFESHWRVGNVLEARQQFARLNEFREDFGLWAPDLNLRARQINMVP